MSEQEPLATLHARNGHLLLYPNRLIFRKHGWLSFFANNSLKHELEINLQQVRAVNLFRPQLLVNGMLIITFVDEREHRIFLVYGAEDYEQVLRIKEHIEDRLSRTEIYPLIKETL